MLRTLWRQDPKGAAGIFALNVISSCTAGIGIVMLIPMLGLLDLSAGEEYAAYFAFLERIPYAGRVTALTALYLLLVTAKAFISRTLAIRESRFVEDCNYRLKDSLYQGVQGADWEYLATCRRTDLINLFTSQCSRVTQGVTEIIRLLSSTVSVLVQLAIAFWMSVPLSLLVLGVGGCFLLLFRPFLLKSRGYGNTLIELSRAFFGELINQLGSIKEIRAYGVQEEQKAIFSNISQKFHRANLEYAKLRSIPGLLLSIGAAALIGIVFLISVLLLHIDTVRLVILVYIFGRLWPVFSSVQGRLQNIVSTIPAHEELKVALDNMQRGGGKEGEAPLGDWRRIRFAGVGFTYRGTEEPVLRGVDFSLERGSVTALVGRSGAGKSTLADLLLGLLHPTEGQILIGDSPLAEENVKSWRRRVGYVPQDPLLLNASVRENLLRFHPKASEEELISALKKALAWPFVEKLPQGMDTKLGDRGIRLSGGERQRIVLARVLIGTPEFIVLDEATSALDHESEAIIREAIASLRGETTLLVVAHRLETIRSADYAVVLEDGAVAEQGPLKALLKRPESYLGRMLILD